GSGAAVGPTRLQFGHVIWVSIGALLPPQRAGDKRIRSAQQLRRLGDVGGDAPALLLNSVRVLLIPVLIRRQGLRLGLSGARAGGIAWRRCLFFGSFPWVFSMMRQFAPSARRSMLRAKN